MEPSKYLQNEKEKNNENLRSSTMKNMVPDDIFLSLLYFRFHRKYFISREHTFLHISKEHGPVLVTDKKMKQIMDGIDLQILG